MPNIPLALLPARGTHNARRRSFVSLPSLLIQHLVFAFLLLTVLPSTCIRNVRNTNDSIISTVHGFGGFPRLNNNPLKVIERDFQALTRRVTAYHILLPKSDEVALALKQSIRNKSSSEYIYQNQYQNQYQSEYEYDAMKSKPEEGASASESEIESEETKTMYIVDAFRQAATKYSRCPDTSKDGGLLGIKVPQGYCRAAPELDRACFQVPLGEVCGPIESEYGYHLLLVEERTNCPKLDGPYTKIVRAGGGRSSTSSSGDQDEEGTDVLFVGPGYKRNNNNAGYDDDDDGNLTTIVVQQIGFWIGISFAGGIVAEIAAKAAGVFDTVPWE